MTIPVSVALKAFLAQGSQTLCTILRIELNDGTVLGFTDHDQDIDYDDGDGSVTYKGGVVSYVRKDVSQGDDLSVDNSEYDGVLNSPAITEASLQSGVWDFASVRYSIVNWADLTMGALRLPGWKLGQVTVNRDQFTTEMRGIMQAYSRVIGEATSPGCRANLGDSRCTVGLGPFTVTGTLTDVSDDQLTLYDTARTEPGPPGGIAISHVSNANPCVITVVDVSSFSNGEAVALSGIVGPAQLNVNVFVRGINTGANTFHIDVDTSNTGVYPPYVSGGTVTPLGGSSGYFDFGVCTMTSGAALGLSRDVMSYVPGQWVLMLPFDMADGPFAVEVGDTYSMVAGCDKSLNTCITRFANADNLQGEPYLPGIDQVVQVQSQP